MFLIINSLNLFFINLFYTFVCNFDPMWPVLPVIWFSVAIFLFSTGFIGIFFNNKNFLILLFKLELMFLGVNFFLICLSVYTLKYTGFVYSLILFGLTAAESALGLTLFFLFFLKYKTITLQELKFRTDIELNPIHDRNRKPLYPGYRGVLKSHYITFKWEKQLKKKLYLK